jgi:hypothetical protein
MIRFGLLVGVVAIALAQQPRVGRGALAAVEQSFDQRLAKLNPDDPFALIGPTRGVYLDNYGVVFTAEVNLATGPSITPFRPTIGKEDVARVRGKKLEALPRLRATMKEMLVDSAAMLDTVPQEEQVVLGVSLFHRAWEDTAGLPAQIVMQARRKALVDYKLRRDRATLDATVQVREF